MSRRWPREDPAVDPRNQWRAEPDRRSRRIRGGLRRFASAISERQDALFVWALAAAALTAMSVSTLAAAAGGRAEDFAWNA